MGKAKVDLSKATWRKFAPIHQEYAIFELVLDDVILLDVGFSDDGVFEISFYESASNITASWQDFMDVIERGKARAEEDK